jgi:hypothetical protein
VGKQRNTIQSRISQLEAELERLRTIIGPAETKADLEDHVRSAILLSLQREAEVALLKGPVFKSGCRILGAMILLGVAVWIGGTIYSGIKIESISDRSKEALTEIKEAEKIVVDADERVRRIMQSEIEEVSEWADKLVMKIQSVASEADTKITQAASGVKLKSDQVIAELSSTEPNSAKALVKEAADKALRAITQAASGVKLTSDQVIAELASTEPNSTKALVKEAADKASKAITQAASGVKLKSEQVSAELSSTEPNSAKALVKEAADKALRAIEAEKARASERLDVDRLPDLKSLRKQISELKMAGGKLKLRSILAFVDWSWWAMLGTIFTAVIVSVIIWYRTRKS